MGAGNDFTDYMGYRYCELESRIDDCLTVISAGETSLEIDCTDLTAEEQYFFQKELQRKIDEMEKGG